MKVYFTATIVEDEAYKAHYKQVTDTLTKLGHDVLQYGSDHLSPEELINRTDSEIENAYKMLDKLMKQADVVIAEISHPSVGIGYEISEAVSQRKPVLALTNNDAGFQPLATIEGNKSKFIDYKRYDNKNLEAILKNFLDESRAKIDTKFILIISPEIDKYLTWTADERRRHKAQIVRDAITESMQNDKEYVKFLKEQGLE